MFAAVSNVEYVQGRLPAYCLLHLQAPLVVKRNVDGRRIIEVECGHAGRGIRSGNSTTRASTRIVSFEACVGGLRYLIQCVAAGLLVRDKAGTDKELRIERRILQEVINRA